MKGFEIIELNKDGNKRKEINIFKTVYDSEVIKNLITQRCQILKGELSYNTILGIGLKSSKDAIDLDISSIVLTTNGVRAIKSFISEIKDKKYTANIIIETVYNDSIEVVI